MWLTLKNLLFTVLVPGTIAVLIPRALRPGSAEIELEGWRWVGLPLSTAGAAIFFWCLWHFARTGRGTPAPIDPPKVLVVRGLYRHTRNPMYVGVGLVLLGEAALYASGVLLAYALGVLTAFHGFVLLYEEPTLRRKFGPAYDDYRRAVPRWLPQLPRRPRAQLTAKNTKDAKNKL
ncbi:MAG: isoprenylcysteine carboxylmethyltransferase family protein [Gemmatimonadetes bacterium]|nr:isoprenylcysteine carboxylmethyltransferase family protein [Gemmatimonadota bacterium]